MSSKVMPRAVKAVLWSLLFSIVFILSVGIFAVCLWYKNTYDVEFKDLLYTLASPLKGTGESTIALILSVCIPALVIAVAVCAVASFLLWRKPPFLKYVRRVVAGVCVAALLFSCTFAVFALRIPAYIKSLSEKTTIYEDYYVDPDEVEISAVGETKNLIYIYLESMETTYASVEMGGAQSENYMPNMTALAENNLSFSDKADGLGGFHTPLGTGWTMSALLATTSGIPFSFPLGENGHNKMSQREKFASGLTNLGDILAEKGYRQEFLCGSDSAFAGRDTYFRQHGNYDIFDLHTARDEGYIDEDYFVWWGFEDKILYDIARDEISELAAGDVPFNFTMLTVDPHHVNGYRCDLCEDEYGNKLANVISCADRQLSEFIDWCKDQDFYEDTAIIITGDHPRMDTTLVGKTDYYDRTIYNCFINSAVTPEGETTERVFTSFDIFPTTLAAMGFEIEGDNLGLGVNMFSGLPTLAEEIGYETLETEINKFSDYYLLHFS